jgi:hypothetical protein
MGRGGEFDEPRGSGGAPADAGKGGSAGLGVLGTGKGGSPSGDGAAATCWATCSSAMVRVNTSGDSARANFSPSAWSGALSSSTESPLKGEASSVSSDTLMSGGLGVVSVCVSSTSASLAGISSVSAAGAPFMAARSGADTSATVGSECTSSPVAVSARFSSDPPGGGVSSPAICVCMPVSTVGNRVPPPDGASGDTSNSPHAGQGSTGRTRLRSAEQFGQENIGA